MKRVLDLLIAVLFIAVLGVGGYFGYTQYIAKDDNNDDTTTGSSTEQNATITEAGVLQLPLLRMEHLTAILPGVADLPPNLGGAAESEAIRIDLNVDQRPFSLSDDRDASARFSEIRSAYSWTSAASVRFDTFTLNQGVSFVRAMVSQFPTTQQARDFIDDPLVQGYYKALGYTLQDAGDLHGWLLTSGTPVEGTGYAEEHQALLFFDHLGLLVALQANTDADADPALGQQTLLALAPRVLENIRALDVLAGVTVPPTPTPQPLTVSLLTAGIDEGDLDRLFSAPRDWNLNAFYVAADEENIRYSLLELIDFYASFNTPALNQLAAEIDRAGRRYGLIAQAIRVWRPESGCPADAPVRVEMDLALFERPAGADAYMRDPALQEAWRNTGVFTEFQDVGDGIFAFGSVNHACGPMQVVQKSATYERLLFTLSLTAPAGIDRQAVMDQVDAALRTTLNDLYMERLR